MNSVGIFSIQGDFAVDLLRTVNQKNLKDVRAEKAIIGETILFEKSKYRVIVDMVSAHVDYFKPYFKNASMTGTYVINNPYGKMVYDRLVNYQRAKEIGVAVPRTICLPSKEYHPACSPDDLTNLKYPLEWEDIADFIGFPAVLKPYEGHGFRDIYKINNLRDLIACYNSTGQQVMLMQEFIDWDYTLRTFVVGKKHLYSVAHDLSSNQYTDDVKKYKDVPLKKICDRVMQTSVRLDISLFAMEIAVKDGVPYAISFINPNPDLRKESMTEKAYEWLLEKVSSNVIDIARSEEKNTCSFNLDCT